MKLLTSLVIAGILSLPLSASPQDKGKKDTFDCEIIFVPTDPKIVANMLEMAKVTKDDVVYDLGCGDGIIICTAAKRHGAKGVGIDIDPARIRDCKRTMAQMGLTKDQVEIRQGDALKVKDLERATVVALYMLPAFMEKLEPQLKRLKPGTRVVAHDYPFPNTPADRTAEVILTSNDKAHHVYLWTIRAPKR